jgi:hypothetical protein
MTTDPQWCVPRHRLLDHKVAEHLGGNVKLRIADSTPRVS